MAQGKQVLLYLVDGLAGGLRTAEIANWTGHVVACPRKDLARLLDRPETKRTGAYLLLGDDPEADASPAGQVYVGESDDVATRLKQHHAKKDWWDRVVVITSQAQAQQLKKHEVRYLESELIQRASELARAKLDNGSSPSFALLSEAEISNMTYFLDQLFVILPTIGVDVFRGTRQPQVTNTDQGVPAVEDVDDKASPVFYLNNSKTRTEGRAQFVDGEFIVLTGSLGAPSFSITERHSATTRRSYTNLQQQLDDLLTKDAVRIENGRAVFIRNVPFRSPSTAGAILLGRACNGRQSWQTEDGRTFHSWESEGIERWE